MVKKRYELSIETKLMLSVDEFCDLISIGRTNFYQKVHKGEILAKKSGRRTLIPSTEVQRYINSLPDFCDAKQ